MARGGFLRRLFRRKSAGTGSPPPVTGVVPSEPVPEPGSPPPHVAETHVQDAVPAPVAAERWHQDESLLRVLGQATDATAVRRVLDLCDALREPTPPDTWHEQMAALLADNPAGADALRTIALRDTPSDTAEAGHRVPFVRGVVWALGGTDPAEAVPVLVRVVELYGEPGRGRGYGTVAVAAVDVLGSIGGERALPALRQIRAEARLSAVRRAASRKLDRTLAAANLSRADVPEWQAESFELDRDGVRAIALDDGYTMTIRLESDGTITSGYRITGGRRISGKPQSVYVAESIRAAEDIVSSLRTVVYAERFRLKQLMKDQRTLAYEDFIEFYLGSPVTGGLCRSLVWESSIDGGEHWRRFLPVWDARREAWMQLGEDGVTHYISKKSRARVVDPKRITEADMRDWAARLGQLKLKQPFKQVVARW